MSDVSFVVPSPKITRPRAQSPQSAVEYQVNNLLSLPALGLQPGSCDVFGSSLLSVAQQDNIGDALQPARNAMSTLLALSSIKRKFKSRAIAPVKGDVRYNGSGDTKSEHDAVCYWNIYKRSARFV